MATNRTPLIAYFIILALLSAGFIILMKLLGQRGYYLASFYMLGPALAAFLTRRFFYNRKFSDAGLHLGKIGDYVKFWGISIAVGFLPFMIYTIAGAIKWDFSGQVFLEHLARQFELTGQNINDLPAGLTPQIMLTMYFIGGLTVFNFFPGIIPGFGEEFGWRGLMFNQMYRIKPWVAFIVGGLIWYVWHIPLVLVFPPTQNLTTALTILNFIILAIGSICTHAFLAYVFVKTNNIFVTSVAHITLDNVARSFAYFAVLQNQLLANAGLAAAMAIVAAVIFISKEKNVFEKYFHKQ